MTAFLQNKRDIDVDTMLFLDMQIRQSITTTKLICDCRKTEYEQNDFNISNANRNDHVEANALTVDQSGRIAVGKLGYSLFIQFRTYLNSKRPQKISPRSRNRPLEARHCPVRQSLTQPDSSGR